MKASTRKLKLTPWFSGVNPLKSRPGPYQCQCCMDYLLWEDGEWYWNSGGIWHYLVDQNIVWRGLAR